MSAPGTGSTARPAPGDPLGRLLTRPPRPTEPTGRDRPPAQGRDSRRVVSLDVVRGLAVAGMLLVNHSGLPEGTPAQLRHSAWHGMTLADLVFPLFLFAVGVSMPFSRRADRPRAVLTRVAKLVVVGSLLVSAKYQHLSVSTGVLQHIAIAYLTAWLVLRLPQPAQVGAVAALVLGTWAAFTFVAAPGVQPGSYAPGSNLAAAADRLLLGHEAREGILPALVSTLNVLGGVAVGRVLAAGRAVPYRTALLGLGGLVAGAALAFAVPLNKHLWTPSFALVTTGLSALVLAVAYVLLDSRPRPEAARPLRVLGANAIAVYVATSLLFDALLEPIRPALVEPVRLLAGDTAAAVGYAAAALLFGWALGEWLYRRRIFITI